MEIINNIIDVLKDSSCFTTIFFDKDARILDWGCCGFDSWIKCEDPKLFGSVKINGRKTPFTEKEILDIINEEYAEQKWMYDEAKKNGYHEENC